MKIGLPTDEFRSLDSRMWGPSMKPTRKSVRMRSLTSPPDHDIHHAIMRMKEDGVEEANVLWETIQTHTTSKFAWGCTRLSIMMVRRCGEPPPCTRMASSGGFVQGHLDCPQVDQVRVCP